jgi:microsomal dipeptidase-like Zn-dependent dipeptidase
VLVDLHAHYPMHLLEDERQRTHERARAWWRRRILGWIIDRLSRVANYQGPDRTPSVCEAQMRAGNVRVTLSMLYQPFDEMDLGQSYGAPPQAGYFKDIVDQLHTVECHAAEHPRDVAIARSSAELEELLLGDLPILIHAIEGGFQLGETPAAVRRNVHRLAELGVAYVTVAHLFFRDVATNAPALPFLSDRIYQFVFPQHRHEGLTALGRELVEAMVDEGVLIDISHMSAASVGDVFTLLDARKDGEHIPVIATHIAYRFGGLEYCLDDDTITKVAKRGGVLGCILCEHYIISGLRGVERSFEGSVEALCRHIDKIVDLTDGFDRVAIGSDLDGYIKPALCGLQDMSQMKRLQHALHDRYGSENAEKICSGNALRVLRDNWAHKRPRTATTPPGSSTGSDTSTSA